VALLMLAVSPARAGEAPAWLDWRAAPGDTDSVSGCGDIASFEGDLSRRLGEDAATVANRAGVRLTVDMGPASQGAPALVATFASTDGRIIGRRVLESTDSTCATILDALSIATALFFQAAEAPPPPGEAPPAPVAPAPIEAPPAVLDRAAGKPGRVALGARGGALIRAGDVPLGLWGVQASVEVHALTPVARLFFVSLDLSPRQRASSSDLDVDYSVMLATGRAGLCPFELTGPNRALALCAALGVGRVSVEGDDLSVSSRQSRWRLAVDGGATLTQLLTKDWSIAAELRLEVPFQRDRITVTDALGQSGDAFRAQLVGGVAALSVGYSPRLEK
jgi:hypothetical protein